MSLIRKTKGILVAASLFAAMCLSNDAYGQKKRNQKAPAQPAPAQQAPAQGNTNTMPQPQMKTEDISDAELKQFVQASAKAAEVQQESQKAMVAVVEEEKLTVEQFTEMAKAHQEQKLGEVKATPEEKAAFSKAAQRIMDMQPQIEQTLQKAIENEGISLEKFEQIMLAYQQNAAVQARVQKLLEQGPAGNK